ncbi:MAG: hypothetical protein VYA30_03740 [Myxococcota bacterium]|nr:hypothetical protein [Myxococcota bacterium]
MSTTANLDRLKDVCAIGASNELKADALYSELDLLLKQPNRAQVAERVESELRRFLESELSLQKTRAAILDSLATLLADTRLTHSHETPATNPSDAPPPLEKASTPLPDVDLDDLRDALNTDDPAPAWLSQVVSLSSQSLDGTAADPPAQTIEPVPSKLRNEDDPWSQLQIPTLQGNDALPPIPSLKSSDKVQSSPDVATYRRETVHSVAPVVEPAVSGELERALDRLLSAPPRAVSPPAIADPFAPLRVDYATSGVLRCGQRLFPIRTVELGVLSCTVEVSESFETGTLLHLFFELGDGGQVGVNCQLLSAVEKNNLQYIQLKYLDLNDVDRQRIQVIIEGRR